MTAVPHQTLGWLWNVLGQDYTDQQRTYSDLAQTLAQYPGLAPKTDVYTYENGASALLLHFTGTIPVQFRGTTYRFPIALWVPHRYPQEGPLVYVVPTSGMVIRPGQHISGEGRVYHPYLARWMHTPERSNVVEFVTILSEVFAREPPVIAKTAQRQSTRSPVNGPPPIPPLPQELQRSTSNASNVESTHAPPPPPKPFDAPRERASPEPQGLGRYDAPPPLPHQTGNLDQRQGLPSNAYGNGQPVSPRPGSQFQPQRTSSLRHSVTLTQMTGFTEGRNASQIVPPGFSGPAGQGSYDPRQSTSSPPARQNALHHSQLPLQHALPHLAAPSSHQLAGATPYRQPQNTPQMPHVPITQPKQPQVNLLDSPFDLSLPFTTTANFPPPPIPPNPEKDALLQTLSQTLTQQLHGSIAQNTSALPALEAQFSALSTALSSLESEIANTTHLNHTLQSNVSILQHAIHQADGAISAAQSRATKGDIPAIDDMLVAPTVVGKQLYDIVVEARGIEMAIWALQTALVRGRISTDVWAKRTRELSRELFAKKTLEKKIGSGLGLEQ